LPTESATKPCKPTSCRPKRLRTSIGKAIGVGACIFALAVTLFAWEFRRPLFEGNLGVVDPGRAFRSAQPTWRLDRWVNDFHLKSIVNLRGGNPSDWWYAAEVEKTQKNGLSFYDLTLSATRRPSRVELLRLIDILRRCPYPLLIHCKSGADRTGLASTLYLMLERAEPPEQAERAFSIEFGHIPLGGTEHLHEPGSRTTTTRTTLRPIPRLTRPVQGPGAELTRTARRRAQRLSRPIHRINKSSSASGSSETPPSLRPSQQ
jgi:Tyrosine phosphatase family